jgi:cytochrome c-type biogenesis protein CcmH/NrfG
MPRSADVIGAYLETLAGFVDREVTPEASRLQEQIRTSQNDPRVVNKLGVLYARYGLLDRAIEQVSSIGGSYTPALVNLGNAHFMRGSMAEALSSYTLASQREPGNAAALLGLARTNYEMGNQTEVRELYARLKALRPELASQFTYLQPEGEEASRAADATRTRGTPVWDEE